MELEETKIGRLDHKIEKLQILECVPGVEFLRPTPQRQQRVSPGRIRTVRRDRHHHAGDAQHADAHRQCDQHDAAGNSMVVNAHPSGVNCAAVAVRNTTSRSRQVRHREPDHLRAPPYPGNRRGDIPASRDSAAGVTGGAAVRGRRWRKRAIVAGPGNPPVVVDETACLAKRRGFDRQGGGLRQQPSVHRRKGSLLRRERVRQAPGRDGKHGGFTLNAQQIAR